MCRNGQAVVRSIFAGAPAELRGFLVWIPMLPGDSLEAAEAQSRRFRERRVAQGWDADRGLGELFAATLRLTRTAWDVYLVYPRGVRWEDERPPRPAFWMHQLSEAWGADQALRLDRHALDGAVRRSLEGGTGDDEAG